MKTGFIPLPTVEPGRDYIIDHIRNKKNNTNDLSGYGIFPGTKIKMLFSSPSGDPYAYEVMGAVLALRHEDSKNIFVKPSDCDIHP